jgi:hypothetical protein
VAKGIAFYRILRYYYRITRYPETGAQGVTDERTLNPADPQKQRLDTAAVSNRSGSFPICDC